MKDLRNLAIAGLVLALVADGVWSWRQRTATRAVENRAAAAEKKLADREAENMRLQQAVGEARKQVATLEAAEKKAAAIAERQAEKREARAAEKRETRTAEKLAARATAAGATDRRAEPAADWIANAGDAEVVRRLNEQARLQTLRHYGTWLTQLQLAPAQRDQLERLLTDKRQASIDVAAATFQGGADPRDDPVGYQDMVAATRTDLENQIHALLGDAGYASYQQYDRGFGQTQVLNNLGQLLAQIQQPLTAEQTANLQAAMQANETGRVTAKVVKDATAFLSPAQLQVLRDLRALQQTNSKKRNAPVPVLPTAPGGG